MIVNSENKNILSKFVDNTLRISIFLVTTLMFFPGTNPAKLTVLINKTMSLFTSAVSFSSLTKETARAIRLGWVGEGVFIVIFITSIVTCLGIVVAVLGTALTVGNLKCKYNGYRVILLGGILQIGGLFGINTAYKILLETDRPEKIVPVLPEGYYWFLILAIAVIVLAAVKLFTTQKAPKDMGYHIDRPYQLLLMYLPFAMLIFVFAYLPLWGWRYAFFDYQAGSELTWSKFVGFKWFTFLFENEATRNDLFRVLKNTMAMSGLGIATSWLPMVFAVLLAEIKSFKFRLFVQTFTTIPNFISWVLVYAFALAIFSTDGFINSLGISMGWKDEATNFLMGNDFIWIKMLGWGIWKGLGWSAIIYIAAISGIDQQMYEAATIDGAGRFQKMRYITFPSLMPTYFVLLIMSVAAILSNGMDQYLVFENATNTERITVLDLYVYQLGVENGVIALSTVIGMMKSVISVALLFSVNKLSKMVRGISVF